MKLDIVEQFGRTDAQIECVRKELVELVCGVVHRMRCGCKIRGRLELSCSGYSDSNGHGQVGLARTPQQIGGGSLRGALDADFIDPARLDRRSGPMGFLFRRSSNYVMHKEIVELQIAVSQVVELGAAARLGDT